MQLHAFCALISLLLTASVSQAALITYSFSGQDVVTAETVSGTVVFEDLTAAEVGIPVLGTAYGDAVLSMSVMTSGGFAFSTSPATSAVNVNDSAVFNPWQVPDGLPEDTWFVSDLSGFLMGFGDGSGTTWTGEALTQVAGTSGTWTAGVGSFVIVDARSFQLGDVDYSFSPGDPIPEPASSALFGIGALLVAGAIGRSGRLP